MMLWTWIMSNVLRRRLKQSRKLNGLLCGGWWQGMWLPVHMSPRRSAFSPNANAFSYEDMLLSGFLLYLNTSKFEAASFPMKFPYGRGSYDEARPTPLMFGEYYRHLARVSPHLPHLHSTWFVWCQLIEQGAAVCARRVVAGTLTERRHFPFIQDTFCAICGPVPKASKCGRCKLISYCSIEHQKQDWHQHRKHCKKGSPLIPGQPL
mmetsp:Transcript_1630/g.1779  ORF Transcript_1630/g.1779 Transcript_1630/m.1779 type:complete len:207 (+) Transcript_1630:120-740(+)